MMPALSPLSISGVLVMEADEPLNDLVVEFSDGTMSFTEFMESLAPLFGEEL